jgi:DNA-binding MarR family transcriptional regulator
MSTTVAAPAKAPTEKTLHAKWTKPLIEAGYTVIPSIIIQRMGVLGLSAMDFAVFAQIASHWWAPDSSPHPSIKRMAKTLGVSESTVKRSIDRMVTANFLGRKRRPQVKNRHLTNLYDLKPMIVAVTPYALEELENIAERKAKKLKALKKGRPKLVVAK